MFIVTQKRLRCTPLDFTQEVIFQSPPEEHHSYFRFISDEEQDVNVHCTVETRRDRQYRRVIPLTLELKDQGNGPEALFYMTSQKADLLSFTVTDPHQLLNKKTKRNTSTMSFERLSFLHGRGTTPQIFATPTKDQRITQFTVERLSLGPRLP